MTIAIRALPCCTRLPAPVRGQAMIPAPAVLPTHAVPPCSRLAPPRRSTRAALLACPDRSDGGCLTQLAPDRHGDRLKALARWRSCQAGAHVFLAPVPLPARVAVLPTPRPCPIPRLARPR